MPNKINIELKILKSSYSFNLPKLVIKLGQGSYKKGILNWKT